MLSLFYHLPFHFFFYFIHYLFISGEPRCTANFPFFSSGKFRPHSVPFLRPPLTAALLQLGKAQQVCYFVTLTFQKSFFLTHPHCLTHSHFLSGYCIVGLMNHTGKNSVRLFRCRASSRMRIRRKFCSFLMNPGTHTITHRVQCFSMCFRTPCWETGSFCRTFSTCTWHSSSSCTSRTSTSLM